MSTPLANTVTNPLTPLLTPRCRSLFMPFTAMAPPSTKCPTNFFLAWTTKAEKFTLRYRRTVEITLSFHPDSCVVVISLTLPLDYFQTFWDLGYNIIVERPETEKLIQGTPAEHWWSNIDKWRKGPFFFSQ